jgi:hypothetical protein
MQAERTHSPVQPIFRETRFSGQLVGEDMVKMSKSQPRVRIAFSSPTSLLLLFLPVFSARKIEIAAQNAPKVTPQDLTNSLEDPKTIQFRPYFSAGVPRSGVSKDELTFGFALTTLRHRSLALRPVRVVEFVKVPRCPVDLGEFGRVVARWRRNANPEKCRIYRRVYRLVLQSWDTANKPTQLADYSVCTTWGIKDKYIYLLYVLRKRLDYPALKRAVATSALASKFPPWAMRTRATAILSLMCKSAASAGLTKT